MCSIFISCNSGGTYKYISNVESDLLVIGFTGESHVSVITIDKSSQALRAVTVPALWSSWNSDCSLIAGTELVCIDNMKATLQLLNLKKPDAFKVTFLPVIS